MLRARLNRWLVAPALTGAPAFLCALIAVGVPTLVRAAVNGETIGCEFTPYLPFVLAAAIMLRWWQAAGVALTSVAIMGGLFDGSLMHPQPCFAPAAGVFLAASAMMIGIAILVRRLILSLQNRRSDGCEGGIVFSLEKGEVWASWYGDDAPVRLGTQRSVSEMMNDFLAQAELARRLSGK